MISKLELLLNCITIVCIKLVHHIIGQLISIIIFTTFIYFTIIEVLMLIIMKVIIIKKCLRLLVVLND